MFLAPYSDEVRDAIESARTSATSDRAILRVRPHGFNTVRALVLAVVRDLPAEMSIGELREAIEEVRQ